MRITSLVENTAVSDALIAEHGLSLYIETERHKILFDMGQTNAFAENARRLGVDLAAVDIAILSHGHYDHGGGLAKFLEINSRAHVYIHKDAFAPHYNGTEKYIGLDPSLKQSGRIVFTSEECRIDVGLTLLSLNGKKMPHPPLPSGLTERIGDKFIEDDFRHEQYLLIEENGKRVLISGCSHKGILNIVRLIPCDLLVGGFHYSKLPLGEYLETAARELDSYHTNFYTCHCTGVEQYRFMSKYMKKLRYFSGGDTVEL